MVESVELVEDGGAEADAVDGDAAAALPSHVRRVAPALEHLTDALIRIDYGLSIIDAPKLVGLAGAPKLIDVGSVELIDAPLLGDAEVAAFLAQVGSPPACVGGVIECGCQGTAPAVIAVGCPALWEGGSAVSGQSAGGAFDGATAFFGWEGPGGTWAALQLVLACRSLHRGYASTDRVLLTMSDEYGHVGAAVLGKEK